MSQQICCMLCPWMIGTMSRMRRGRTYTCQNSFPISYTALMYLTDMRLCLPYPCRPIQNQLIDTYAQDDRFVSNTGQALKTGCGTHVHVTGYTAPMHIHSQQARHLNNSWHESYATSMSSTSACHIGKPGAPASDQHTYSCWEQMQSQWETSTCLLCSGPQTHAR